MNSYDDTAYGEVPMWQKTSDESFEVLEKMCEKTVSDPDSTLFKYLHGEDVAREKNKVVMWQKATDESFEALEKMCNKTASDPNSTLFQYIHSDRKEQILAEAKKRSADENALSAQNKEDDLLMKLNNCTLLEDVEAPSRMWENTICGDTILQTSPVKMIGLLRPSTIIEEAPNDSAHSDVSSQMSFRTATKGIHSDVSSSTYDTAHDSTVASGRTDIASKCHQKDELELIDVDNVLLCALAKNEQNRACAAQIIPSIELLEATIVESSPCNTYETEINSNNMNLISLEETFGPLHDSPHSSMLKECVADNAETKNDEISENEEECEHKADSYNVLDDSVIEISDEDDNDDNDKENEDEQIFYTNIKSEMCSKTSSFSINHDTYSFDESLENNKGNCTETHEPSEKSMQFNDTMEEVEYMLKKGMEYMAAQADTKKSPANLKSTIPKGKTNSVSKAQPNSPIIHKKSGAFVSSPASKVKTPQYKTPAKRTPLTKGQNSSTKHYDIDIKPFPKLDIFAKPPVHARTKELMSKQQKFSHIVSPIGTYMKKTAKTPLMTSINSKNKDYFNSTAILELDNESRLYQPHFSTGSNGCEANGLAKLPGLTNSAKRPLPKKAYISSDLKHIVDERTPVTIPGGKKIQKYLENAMMPAVLRHEGKFKIPGVVNNKSNTSTVSSTAIHPKVPLKVSDTNSTVAGKSFSHIPRRNNASLADLSVMSGDVSMYTIMDAQKF